MKKHLTTFFQAYPRPQTGDVCTALDMVIKNLKHAKRHYKQSEMEGEHYLKHMAEAHRMLESMFSELGKHPTNYPM